MDERHFSSVYKAKKVYTLKRESMSMAVLSKSKGKRRPCDQRVDATSQHSCPFGIWCILLCPSRALALASSLSLSPTATIFLAGAGATSPAHWAVFDR